MRDARTALATKVSRSSGGPPVVVMRTSSNANASSVSRSERRV